MLMNITLPLPIKDEFTYSAGDDFSGMHLIGCRVIVEFNKRKMIGVITSLPENIRQGRISDIIEILDDTPVLSVEMLKFCRWISDYYLCSLGEVLKLALPSLLQAKNSKVVTLTCADPGSELSDYDKSILQFLKEFAPVKTDEIEKLFGSDYGQALIRLKKKGLIAINDFIEQRKREVSLKGYRRTEISVNEISGYPPGAFDELISSYENDEVILLKNIKEKNISLSLIKKALAAGIVTEVSVQKDHITRLLTEPVKSADIPVMNEEQTVCSDEITECIEKEQHKTFLIHGITGSGKTIVYVSVISKAIKKGKTAIVLVPEISLTPQTVRRFRSHFGDKIAVLHSRLTDYEKLESWEKIRSGECTIVIGPRSAIFAPLKNIGVIIVDEEHDSSYKQNDPPPRYCARNSAVIRGYFNNAPVVLGSATPSLESYYNAAEGKYRLLEIKNRFSSAVLPAMNIVKKENYSDLFEKPVLRLFQRELDLGRKIMVLQNRRGYSSHLVCKSCGNSASCPNCSVSLTYHLDRNQMICHYCGYYEKGKNHCSACGSDTVFFKGAGTEQVESELKRLFPSVPVLRMDYDTTRSKDGHSKILDEFEKPGPGILVGTQMIAKGLDFHAVSVVCIVNIDGELIFPDFRSDEKAFQLIEQVAGRAGRGSVSGKVVIQSFNENNPLLKFSLAHDYHGFINEELNIRKLTLYPPFSRIIKITLSSHDLSEVKKAASELYSSLLPLNKNCVIYKPVDKMILKVNNIFRLYILIKSSIINDRNGKMSRDLVSSALDSFKSSSKFKIDVDVDPSDIM